MNETPLPMAQQPSDELQFLFYQPGRPDHPFSAPTKPPKKAKWEKLSDRIGLAATLSERLDPSTFLATLSPHTGDTALEAASRLATDSSPIDKANRELILISICNILYNSGRVSPERLDDLIKMVVRSSLPSYFDKIKRGARVANQIIAGWAERYANGDLLYRLDQATQAVLRARLSISQWGVLSERGNQVKERVLSFPLPEVPQVDTPVLLIPLLIASITNRYIKLSEICSCLGYTPQTATCIAEEDTRRTVKDL